MSPTTLILFTFCAKACSSLKIWLTRSWFDSFSKLALIFDLHRLLDFFTQEKISPFDWVFFLILIPSLNEWIRTHNLLMATRTLYHCANVWQGSKVSHALFRFTTAGTSSVKFAGWVWSRKGQTWSRSWSAWPSSFPRTRPSSSPLPSPSLSSPGMAEILHQLTWIPANLNQN